MSNETRVTRLIEFITDVNPPSQSTPGTGKLEIKVDGKTRYRINYKLNNQAATDHLLAKIPILEDEFQTLLKLTLGIFGHRLILNTIGQMSDEDPVVESIEREQHIPDLVIADVHNNPTLSVEPLTALLPRLHSAQKRMKEYGAFLNELHGLRTEPDFTDFREIYDNILPNVVQAQEMAKLYIREDEKTWVRKILNEFKEYTFGAEDLVLRLSEDYRFVPEKTLTVLIERGAEPFQPQHIALEMAARICGCADYQYSIKRLEEFRAGNFPVSGKTRKREHEESLTRGESVFLLSPFLSG